MPTRHPLALALATLSACASTDAPAVPAGSAIEPPVSSAVSADDVGKPVRLEGFAVNRKDGAVLAVGEEHVWIDGLPSWPDGYYEGGDRGKRLTVSGTLDQDHRPGLFIEKEGEPAIQGIPVPEGTDLKEASRRFVLRDAKW